jgi:hypothetical protein
MPIFGGIFVGRRFGAFDSTPAGGRVDDSVGPAFPPAGSFNSTLTGTEYPIAEGGGSFLNPETNDPVPNQICTVDVLNDGSGGTYVDWTSVRDIGYYPADTTFYVGAGGSADVYVPEVNQSFTYYTFSSTTYNHDGSGGYNSTTNGSSYVSAGTVYATYGDISTNGGQTGSPYSYNNGNSNSYVDFYPHFFLLEVVSDGASAYSIQTSTSTGTAPEGHVIDTFSYTVEVPGFGTVGTGKYEQYVWNYATGVTTQSDLGSFAPNGGYIGNADALTEVPSGSNSYYSNGKNQDAFWNGSGGYYFDNLSGSYFESGTYITNDGTYDYYWDGNGGYYT